MLLLRTEKLAEGDEWLYELKLDGFRAVAFKSNGKVFIRSRNNKDFNSKFPSIVNALAALPDETIIDGEIVAILERSQALSCEFLYGLLFMVFIDFLLMLLLVKLVLQNILECSRHILVLVARFNYLRSGLEFALDDH